MDGGGWGGQMARVRAQNERLAIAENEPLIESSFRRLLASIESERDKIRSTWQEIDVKNEEMHDELEGLRRDVDEWCKREQQKIETGWREIDKLRETTSVLPPVEASDVLPINCSGHFFNVPKALLCNIEGSLLNHMFSKEFIKDVPRDPEGRFFLDYNGICFGIIVEYLKRPPDAPPPPIPPEHQMNMDLLVEALRLKSFHRPNTVLPGMGTSLRVNQTKNTIEATHEGWQVISATYPLSMVGTSFFEIKILANPMPKGGLAVGVCGHVPGGAEVHSICVPYFVGYNSNIGLIGRDNICQENVEKGHKFSEGCTIGVSHDVQTHSLKWYFNKVCIGTCTLAQSSLEHMRQLYPVFGVLLPGQKIQVDFDPSLRGDKDKSSNKPEGPPTAMAALGNVPAGGGR